MVVLSILEEKARISVTTEFIPRSSISIFPAPLKLFCSGNSNKGNHPPACALSFKHLACRFLGAQTSACHFCTERKLDQAVKVPCKFKLLT